MPLVRLFLDPSSDSDLRKLGVRNIAQYSAASVPLSAVYYSPTFTSSMMLSAMFTGALALVPRSYDCETRLLAKLKSPFCWIDIQGLFTFTFQGCIIWH